MCSAVTKFIPAAMVALLMVSCQGNGEKEQAESLYNQASEALEQCDYNLALRLVDSIRTAYPKQIETRRNSLHIMARANEGLALSGFQSADSLVAVLSAELESMAGNVKKVDNPIEDYYVAVSADPQKLYDADGLQARMSPQGDLYVISCLKSRKVQSTSVAVEYNGRKAESATVAYDGERNDRSLGAEVITFMGAECDSLTKFIAENSGNPLNLTFTGSGTYTMRLSEKQVNDIAAVTNYATTLRRLKAASVERERQQRLLETARQQAARTFPEGE